jgi:hypothetical protein
VFFVTCCSLNDIISTNTLTSGDDWLLCVFLGCRLVCLVDGVRYCIADEGRFVEQSRCAGDDRREHCRHQQDRQLDAVGQRRSSVFCHHSEHEQWCRLLVSDIAGFLSYRIKSLDYKNHHVDLFSRP